MSLNNQIAQQLNIDARWINSTVELLDAENTIPFIARYRKEATGGLDEEQLRNINDLLEKLRSLDERRETILKSIEDQGKLTPELKAQLLAAESRTELEDLYQPYKPKRKTRASIARDQGLQPLADLIVEQGHNDQSLEVLALPFLQDSVPTVEDAWAGARDIVAEMISDHPQVRSLTRQKAFQRGTLASEKIQQAEDARRVYEVYYEFQIPINRLRPHQTLAINRGEADKVLRVKVSLPEGDWLDVIRSIYPLHPRSPFSGQLSLAYQDAAERLLLPAIERDVRRELTEKADIHAINVFAENLRALLSQPPLIGHTVLGIDPGFRTGCKIAVVQPTGKVLATATIFPHEPQKRWDEALKKLVSLVSEHKVTLVVIGNGTASRETEQLVASLTRSMESLKYVIVNEAGASVYSASPLARAELPDLDVSMRGAVSIARRIQDPLAELVKIDPKSIGVGMYQHDVDQKLLAQTLAGVVESVVNQVGVDVNTASPALLTYVAGIGQKLAERIVAQRELNGPYLDRQGFKNVPGMGPKSFEQSAGFLRVLNGKNPLDTSAIHPESYPIAVAVLERASLSLDTPAPDRKIALNTLLEKMSLASFASELNVGMPTLRDIFEQLVRPGRDPRHDLPSPVLRSDIMKMEDLEAGMRMRGTVRNVVDFGAFVDIGVKQDGLLHRSQIPQGIELKVGYVIEVIIISVEIERGRISLGWPP